ncbi:threonine--tRNA ligase [Candidatus Roizmanbacteria bacterium RIFCSPHIGHO2_02_FULL_43_11]|uniref:Threonine--tRNA ligase n=1 Tax=Candidatus Roizmanbacteria bacterium RIFCSPHIGHO2_02_FULL_43_11 TaxID=1802043 RepID=A0A1F7HM78_9BACT|nr:MAG: threonine--tRNA ligase [Candidatus Roizmanbacteria bacterium RIFCSPHIGHO2_02_FULL_43_11]
MSDNQEYLNNVRHSCAHLLAKAVKDLWPGTHNAIGPSIENGFYQDFDFGDIKISEADLPMIEKRMHELLPQWKEFVFNEVTPEKARELFKDNPYKLELLEEFAQDGKKLLTNNPGDFLDLCKMGHVEKPSQELQNFKLLSVAGAYWRGDEKNKMLTRIYGTAFPTAEELEKHLHTLEEARKRDHKILGRQLGLFTFSDLVGAGLPLWTPKGTLIRTLLDDYIWSLRKEKGYQKVAIPHITKKDLYEKSGHWEKFSDELFKIQTREGHLFAMKPMNCPHHTQIYAAEMRSYRDLPQRYAETTMVYRDEQTGELSGLSRVRCITQDDAHVFCRVSQIEDEALAIWDIVNHFYEALNFPLKIRLSLHDPVGMDAYLGSEDQWQTAEEKLRTLLKKNGADFYEGIGEAAFYGPKIDFISHDSLGREWQVATMQLDINMPERFNLFCINESGEEERIVMIHAAIMGSIERFMSVLIEHYAGAFPTWLSPVQVAVIPISEKHADLAEKVHSQLQEAGIRADLDSDNKTVSAKIRHHTLQKIPYMCIIGDTEAQKSASDGAQLYVSVRTREGVDQGLMSLSAFKDNILYEISNKKA